MSEYAPELRQEAEKRFKSPAAMTATRLGMYRINARQSHIHTELPYDDSISSSGIMTKGASTNASRRTPSVIRSQGDRKLFDALAQASTVTVTPRKKTEPPTFPMSAPSSILTEARSVFFCSAAFELLGSEPETKPLSPRSPNSMLPHYVPGLPLGLDKQNISQFSLLDSDYEDRDDTSCGRCSTSQYTKGTENGGDSIMTPSQRSRTFEPSNYRIQHLELNDLVGTCDENHSTRSEHITSPPAFTSRSARSPRLMDFAEPTFTPHASSTRSTSGVSFPFRESPHAISKATLASPHHSLPRSFRSSPINTPLSKSITPHSKPITPQPMVISKQRFVTPPRCARPDPPVKVPITPSHEKSPPPSCEKVPPLSLEKVPLPSQEKTPSPSHEKAPSPTHEKVPSPIHEKTPPPSMTLHIITKSELAEAARKIQRFMKRRHALQFRAASRIARMVRSWRSRRHAHAARIQSTWRAYFATQTRAATRMQALWRRKQSIRYRRSLQTASQLLGRVLVKRIQHKRMACTWVQKEWRRAIAKVRYTKATLSILKLQACFRAWYHRLQFRRSVQTAIMLQTLWRNTQARRSMKRIVLRIFSKESQEAVAIQKNWRVISERRRYASLRRGAIRLQAMIRKYQCRQRYLLYRTAVSTLQNNWRSKYSKKIASAIIIQAVTRCFVLHTRYTSTRVAALRVQTYWRTYIARIRYLTKLSAIRHFQALSRGWKTRLELERAALRSISLLRTAYLEAQHAVREEAAAIIQAHWRLKTIQLRLAELQAQQKAATVIQRVWRGRVCRCRYYDECTFLRSMRWRRTREKRLRQCRAAVRIQKRFRGNLCRHRHKLFLRSVVVLQTRVLRFLAVRRAARIVHGLTRFQSLWRGKCQRRQFVLIRSSVTRIQGAYRMYLAMHGAERRRVAVVVIQRHVRGYLCRQWLRRAYRSIVRLQTALRQWTVRREYTKYISAVVKIQSQWRGVMQRNSLEYMVAQATKLQAVIRWYLVAVSLKVQKEAAMAIQRVWRGVQTRRENFSARRAILLLRELVQSRKEVQKSNEVTKHVQLYWENSSEGQGIGARWHNGEITLFHHYEDAL
jgi:hypothetical protein